MNYSRGSSGMGPSISPKHGNNAVDCPSNAQDSFLSKLRLHQKTLALWTLPTISE